MRQLDKPVVQSWYDTGTCSAWQQLHRQKAGASRWVPLAFRQADTVKHQQYTRQMDPAERLTRQQYRQQIGPTANSTPLYIPPQPGLT